MLPGFGPGQGVISGQAVRFPLLVKIDMDDDLRYDGLGDENFLQQARDWKPDAKAATVPKWQPQQTKWQVFLEEPEERNGQKKR